ncbi:hypothetical protein [Paenibacillus pabuli]|uniref:hypothetical protein n=1 Tax=Paenibacillus pabuli TaxID=1472 RepID=UPI001FFEC2C1|nr:hypothetical protein [Paenibacillus pabuli]UPK44967.1 hypothetical protein KET34_05525 [Paenibacillus pabuli]
MISIFSLIFIIISSYLFFYIFNQSSNTKNFYDNKNAHLIRIEGKLNNNTLGKLDREDTERIEGILKNSGEGYKISTIFKLSSGIINASDNKGVIIYGLDEVFPEMFNDHFQMKNNILYSDIESDELKLIIPNIHFTKQGDITSNSFDEKIFKLNNIYDLVEQSSMDYFFSRKVNDLPMIFASQATFSDILNVMFKGDSNRGNSQSRSIYDFIDVEEVLLYINNIHSLNGLVDQLRNEEFHVTYAFDSFENLSTDLGKSNTLYNLILALLFVLSSIYMIITYRNYLNSQQKDIGIFKVFGYSNQDIRLLYNRVLFKLFGIVFVLTCIFNIIICFNRWVTFSFILVIEAIMMLLIIWLVSYFQIRRVVNKGVLSLVKEDKEFE